MIKTCFFLWAVLFGLYIPVAAQSLQQDQDTLAQQLEARYRHDSLRAAAIAEEQGFSLYHVAEDGTITGFAGFSETGMMLFNTTCNAGAGRTVGTNQVWPGGAAGTSLTGDLAGNRLGIWDGGGVRLSHQEFDGRVAQADGGAGDKEHPTHVAGTMIAAGVDATAKGMAYEATLRAYDWNNDDGEMAAAAGAGMLISNHSYGQAAGWNNSSGNWRWYGDVSISAVEDYSYGFYNRRAETWDRIAVNNPYYLICKAAGNDRDKSHSGTHEVLINNSWQTSTAQRNDVGPYDCIASYAVAKNILTVGAVRKITGGWTEPSDVVMTSFSGWGPADDGRIKPDVVAPGQNIKSSTDGSDYAYESFQGTSMATPVVSGSLILLQEQYHDLHNDFMLASALKGLTIHTTDEAGTAPGPDYQYGWGLINIPRAVAMINSGLPYSIQQRTLGNNETFAQSYTTDGSEPLKLTICWTDPPGKPVAPALDPTDLMLVNDLDIRLIRKSDGVVLQPYILNPANPSAAATTGDNFRDNVEQIFISAPQPGAYKLVVSHKNELHEGKPQPYSLIVSGVEPVAPVAGFTVQKLTVCADEPVRFTDTSENDPHAWDWLLSDGSRTATATTSQAEISYSTPGIYTVDAALKVSNYGGTDSIKRTVIVEVLERPAAIQVSGNEQSMAHREEMYRVSNTTGSTYAWRIENGTVQSGNGTNEVVVKWGNHLSGRVAVQETNSVSCSGDTAFLDIELEWATRVSDVVIAPFSIYPNPASDHLSVAFHAAAAQRVKVNITNLVGQTVFTATWDVLPGPVVKDLHIGEVPAGVYLFRLEGDFSPEVQKIVIN